MMNVARPIDLENIRAKVEEIHASTEQTAVVFFDLVSATAYKGNREIITSLVKVYRHNTLIADRIREHSGKVVKLLGDGVLGTFSVRKPDDIEVPLSVARRVLRDLRERNTGLPREEKILSHIGICCGKVVDFASFSPEGEVIADPQGPVVDLAARLCSIAGPEQALCDERTVALTKEAGIGFSFVGPEARRFKGFENPLEVFALTWTKTTGKNSIPHSAPVLYSEGFLSPSFVVQRVQESKNLVRLAGLSNRHFCDDAELQSAIVRCVHANAEFEFVLTFLNPFSPFLEYARRITRRRSKDLQGEILRNIKKASDFFVDLADNVKIVCADYSMAIPFLQSDNELYFSVPTWSMSKMGKGRAGVIGGPYFRTQVSSPLSQRILYSIDEDVTVRIPIRTVATGKTEIRDFLSPK